MPPAVEKSVKEKRLKQKTTETNKEMTSSEVISLYITFVIEAGVLSIDFFRLYRIINKINWF